MLLLRRGQVRSGRWPTARCARLLSIVWSLSVRIVIPDKQFFQAFDTLQQPCDGLSHFKNLLALFAVLLLEDGFYELDVTFDRIK